MQIIQKDINELIPYNRNQKRHDDKQIQNVANSIKRFGWKQPIVIDKNDVVVIGHCRLLAAKKLGLKEVPCLIADDLTEDEIRELRIADNKTNESEWDFDFLTDDVKELSFDGFDFDFDFPVDIGNEVTSDGENVGSLADRFLIAPFSVIYGNKHEWLSRKIEWINCGLHSEIGRGGGLIFENQDSLNGIMIGGRKK